MSPFCSVLLDRDESVVVSPEEKPQLTKVARLRTRREVRKRRVIGVRNARNLQLSRWDALEM